MAARYYPGARSYLGVWGLLSRVGEKGIHVGEFRKEDKQMYCTAGDRQKSGI